MPASVQRLPDPNPENKYSIKMKTPKPNNMITSLAISTSLYDADLLTNIVEKLACRRNDNPVYPAALEPNSEAIGTSSLEAFVSGTADISYGPDFLKMPFTTCFLFTCIRAKGQHYKLTFSSSLS
jgi:hypothetical protein